MKFWIMAQTLVLTLSLNSFGQTNDFIKFFSENYTDATLLKSKSKSENIQGSKSLLTIKPNGKFKLPVNPKCQINQLEKLILKPNLPAQDFAKNAKKYFDECEENLHQKSTPGLAGLVEFAMAEYHFLENGKIRPISFTFSDGTTSLGFIGIKDTSSRRPWVIAKCGVFCSAGESASVNNYMMALFDESPFNVIFLGNRTGTDYIQKNKKLLIGGFLESHDYIEIARWLKDKSPYSNTVDSIHTLGISLAGNAAAISSVIEKFYPDLRGKNYIDSAAAICPVIDLHPTLKDMYSNSIKGEIFVRYTWSELKKVKDALPEYNDKLSQPVRPPKEEFPSMMGDMITYYGTDWASKSSSNRNGIDYLNIEDTWQLNQFSNQTSTDIPLLVWASEDDHIVNNKLNTQNLMSSEIGKSKNVGIVNLKYGDHCGFSTAYGYPVPSTLLRAWILNNSPKFSTKRKIRKAVVNFGIQDLLKGQPIVKAWFEIGAEKSKVTFNYQVKASSELSDCISPELYDLPASCYTTRSVKIPITEFKFLNLKVPKTDVEAQVMTRYLNSTLVVKDRRNNLTEGSYLAPDSVSWASYY